MRSFITKVGLEASLKNHTGEKCAQFIASKLDGRAFDVYMRLSEEDKKKDNRIKEELLKEFERGQLNREEAIHLLSGRPRQLVESSQTYAYKLMELVKLAYPNFDEATRETIAKDYFMRGIHPNMQIAIKSNEKFASSDLKKFTAESSRLELTGIRSIRDDLHSADPVSSARNTHINTIDRQSFENTDLVDSIASKVLEKLYSIQLNHGSNACNDARSDSSAQTGVDYASSDYRGNRRGYRGRRGMFKI